MNAIIDATTTKKPSKHFQH